MNQAVELVRDSGGLGFFLGQASLDGFDLSLLGTELWLKRIW